MADIAEDPNFKLLAACQTSTDEFKSLIAANVAGYTQKKRVVDALKPMVASLDAVGTKVMIRASVGKGKAMLTALEQAFYDTHKIDDIREKIRIINAELQTALEEGRVTIHEKQAVLEDLQTRLQAAEEAGKQTLKEKLERGIAGVEGAEPYALPMPDALEIDSLKKQLRTIKELEKKDWWSLTEYEQRKVEQRWDVSWNIKEIEDRNRMWFETDAEFKQRLEHALVNVTSIRLEQRRLERKDLPVKSAPQPKKKEKKRVIKLDNRDLFTVPADDEPEQVEDSVDTTADDPNSDPTPSPCESPKLAPAAAPDTAAQPQEEPVQEATAPAKLAPTTAATAPAPEQAPQDDQEDGKDPLPSAAKAEKLKKVPGPAPKKREKKKFTKMDASTLGFELA